MNDIERVQNAYKAMYDAMIKKYRYGLDTILDDGFVLVHMTGMRQTKSEFIDAVLDGTLNYYSAVHENMPVTTNGDNAVIKGQSYVQAAVFGGGKNYWRLQQKCSLKKSGGEWKITRSVASVY